MTVQIRALREEQIVAAGRVLAAAFHADPLEVFVFPDAEERARRAPEQFSILVQEAFLFGEVFVTEDLSGISAWFPPNVAITREKAKRAGYHRLPDAMGTEAFERFGRVLEYVSRTNNARRPAACWYLTMIGVVPDCRGHGRGEALLEPILRRADAAGTAICLDTAQPRVRPLYERLGFRPVIETVDPRSGLRLWGYLRDPAQ
jgi:GNAT superfamily N-acetyltransferase